MQYVGDHGIIKFPTFRGFSPNAPNREKTHKSTKQKKGERERERESGAPGERPQAAANRQPTGSQPPAMHQTCACQAAALRAHPRGGRRPDPTTWTNGTNRSLALSLSLSSFLCVFCILCVFSLFDKIVPNLQIQCFRTNRLDQ